MDAREKWAQDAEPYLHELAGCAIGYQGQELVDALYKLRAHLRTTPEGFALVPVPEWVPVGERLPVVPEGSDYVCIWCWKEGALRTPWVSRWYGGFSANAEYFTHWQYHIANTPAPPEDL